MTTAKIRSEFGVIDSVDLNKAQGTVRYQNHRLLTFQFTHWHSGWPRRMPLVDDLVEIRFSDEGEYISVRRLSSSGA